MPADALAALAPHLRCPHCGAALRLAGSALACDRGHSYDRARDGHVTLLPPRGRLPRADSAAMVAARDAFLGAGHYAPIERAVAAAACEAAAGPRAASGGCVVDIGAGTGRHLAAVLEALDGWGGIALDASRTALRRAVQAHPRIAAVACDVWQPLPVARADLALNVFAPRNGAEIARVLSPAGALVVVTPAADHLRELVLALGLLRVDADKEARLRRALLPHLRPVDRRAVGFALTLGRSDVEALVSMGPSAHHLGADAIRERVAGLPEQVAVTASVDVAIFRPAR
jgi:23S rRNA (guanine745-N1)-methyltransferase